MMIKTLREDDLKILFMSKFWPRESILKNGKHLKKI